MSILTELPIANNTSKWIDIIDPSQKELTQLARQYGLHPVHVKNCLDANHLPKYEETGDSVFILVRAYDAASQAEASTVQGLTRRVALFIKPGVLLTFHRKDQLWIEQLRSKWKLTGSANT